MFSGATVLDLPEEERPRERLYQKGLQAMTSLELIAIILGSGSRRHPVLGVAHNLLTRFSNIAGLAEASIEELCQVGGMGKAKAIQLKAAIGLGMRVAASHEQERLEMTNPATVYHIVKDKFENEPREIALVVLLDTKCRLIGQHVVSIGTISQTFMHPREIFHLAVRHKAASMILVHNHPSGDPTPSKQDLELTERMVEAGKMMGIAVLDHLVVGNKKFYSIGKNKAF